MSARRPWAWPLVPVYRAAVAAETALYRAGVLRTRRLGWPVVSVGSLSAGGAGKTPVVIALASMLRERGWGVDVLSRGYRREGLETGRVVNPEGRADEAAKRFGDEPVVIAERTGVPVWVGSSRFRAGRLAEEEAAREQGSALHRQHREWRDRDKPDEVDASSGPAALEETPARVHLLDDGFQHRKLARDFDVVLVTQEDLQDALLPAGNLREPLTALRRADAVVLREEEREDIEVEVRALVGPGIPLWSVRRSLRFPQPLGVFSAGLRPVGFCAIARPEGFAAMLAESGCGVVETVAFPDHHTLDQRDIERLLEVASELGATGFVTTEKDAVKLSPTQLKQLAAPGPLAVVALEAEFVFKSPVMRALEARLRPEGQGEGPFQAADRGGQQAAADGAAPETSQPREGHRP